MHIRSTMMLVCLVAAVVAVGAALRAAGYERRVRALLVRLDGPAPAPDTIRAPIATPAPVLGGPAPAPTAAVAAPGWPEVIATAGAPRSTTSTADQRPPTPPKPASSTTLEERLGKHAATWIGAIAILAASGFYVRLAASRGLIGPAGKLALIVGIGALCGLVGDRLLRRDARLLGQGLMGVGLGLVFCAGYAGFARYQLFGAELAAAVMVIVTALGLAAAVRRDAAAIAVLAVLGGYLTPALVSDGTGTREVLCGYLLLLDLGVLGVALVRRWRGLEWVAGAATWLLVAGWYHRADAPAQVPTLAWCLTFAALFIAVPLAYHLRRRIALPRGRVRLAILDGLVGFGFAAVVVDGASHALAALAGGFALAYLGVVSLTRRRLPGDGAAHARFAIVAIAFATLAVPMWMRGSGVTLAWAVEAPVLLVAGTHYRLRAARLAGAAVLALAAAHFVTGHVPLHPELATPFINSAFASAALLAAAAGSYAWLGRRAAGWLGDERLARVAAWTGWGAVALVLVLLDRELWLTARWASGVELARPLGLAYALAVAAIAGLAPPRRDDHRGVVTMAALVVAAARAILLVDQPLAGIPVVNPAFLLGAITCGVMAAVAHRWRATTSEATTLVRDVGTFILAAAAIGAWLLISHEAWGHARLGVDDPVRARWLGQAALTCAWGASAGALLVIGFRLRAPTARLAALALFGLTVAKVLLVDLARVDQGYRVLSLVVLGTLLLAVSALYHRRRS
ncbi:MAG: DUF2339 domain-containing protein [Kofleriaceae bacterium]